MKTYLVSGPHAIDGTPSGATFTADYSPEHEAYLVTAGHVQIVDSEAPTGAGEQTGEVVNSEVPDGAAGETPESADGAEGVDPNG